MNLLATIISCLAGKYYDDAFVDQRDCRLLIPAPSLEIARQTHELLREQGKRTFLVVGKDDLPSEEKGWLKADGLTSERVGSFIAICCPGVLSHLQDSISGSGGAIRSLAFSDEWPWVDNGPENFRFLDEVLPKLGVAITPDTAMQEFIKLIILELLASSSSIKNRQCLVLDEILGSYDNTKYSTIKSEIEKFLFHSGLPYSVSYEYGEGYLEILKGLSNKILDELKKLDRYHLVSSIDEKFDNLNEADRKTIKKALEDFLDALGGKDLLTGILVYRSAFFNNLVTWKVLSLEVLETIFGKFIDPTKTKLEILFSSERGVTSGNSIATFMEEEITCTVTYNFPPGESLSEIRLLHGGKVLGTIEVTDTNNSIEFKLDTFTLFKSYKKKLTITAQAFIEGQKVKEKKGSIHLCGYARPGLLVVYPIMEIIDLVSKTPEDIEQDDIEKINVKESIEIYLLSLEDGVMLGENLDQIDSKKIQPGIIKSSKLIDPCESASGNVTIYCKVGEEDTAAVCIEAIDVIKGEFTLEDELRTLLTAGTNSQRFKSVLDIFSGKSRERYRNLGNLNERTNKRSYLAHCFERGESPYLPVVVSLGEGYAQREELWSCARVIGLIPSLATLKDKVRDNVAHLVHSYAVARDELMQNVAQSLDIDPEKLERPLYAETPLFVASINDTLAELIGKYLDSYISILNFIEKYHLESNWGELFLLSYLDCVVDLGKIYGGKYFIVGPWHPLVVCKRYFIQSALFRSSQRFANSETKPGFSRLATLFRYVNSLRWSYVLDNKAKSFKKAYLAALSDPAWILGLQIGDSSLSNYDVKAVLELMSKEFGFDTNVLPASCEHLAGNYVKDFLNSYPSRRAIGMRIEESYMPEQVINSLNELLVSSAGEETQVSVNLRGGIHAYFKSASSDVERLSRPASSRVFIYERDDDVYESMPVDISLLPPIRDISFSNYEEDYCLPRGYGDETAFYAPLTRLVSGLEAIPTSQVLEVDSHRRDTTYLDGKFLDIACHLARLAATGTCTNLQANLPDSLKCSWNVLPGMQLDPAIFRYYVRAGANKEEDRALWDYNVDIEGRVNTYYVISRVPAGIVTSLKKNPVLRNHPGIVKSILSDLGEIGIAVGNEAMKTSSRALGVVGLVAAIRLFSRGRNGIPSPLSNGKREVGFLLPVDSFKAFLGDLNSESQKRADLLAIQISLPQDAQPMLISACAIECKYSSSIYPESAAKLALEEQALSTIENFKYLVLESKNGGTPEKLALLNLISFGLRTQAREDSEWTTIEQKVLQAILESNYNFIEPRCGCVLVSTEIELALENASFNKEYGYWVRLAPGCWPETEEHENLDYSRKMLSSIFRDLKSNADVYSPKERVTSTEIPEAKTRTIETPTHKEPISFKPAVETPIVEQPIIDASSEYGVKFLVGKGKSLNAPEYFFNPSNTKLSQLNIGIIGTLGTGKTQLVQSLVYRLVKSSKDNWGVAPKFLIFDYKGDYAKESFVRAVGANVVQPYRIPLSLFDISLSGDLNPRITKANFFVDILDKIFSGMGYPQKNKVKQAVKNSFEDAELTGTIPTIQQVFENYKAIVGVVDSPFSILNDMCDRELFEQNPTKVMSFKDFFQGVTVIDLSLLGAENNPKNMLVVIFLNMFYDYMLKLEKSKFKGKDPQLRFIDSYLLVDEAENIMKYNFDVLMNVLLQGRDFGAGVMLASQFLSHFKKTGVNYADPLLTWFIHKVPNLTKAELISIGISTTDATDALVNKIKGLENHECLYKSLDVS